MRVLAAVLALALLAGCVEPDAADADAGATSSPSKSTSSSSPGGGPNGFAVQQGAEHGFNQGIEINVTWRACEAGFCADATATNRGGSAVQVSSICESPWTDRMTHDGAFVDHREPQAMCLAYGRKAFAPGDSAMHGFTWDGQLHQGGRASPAPEGSYTWTVAFWWETDSEGSRQEVAVDVPLIIGET